MISEPELVGEQDDWGRPEELDDRGRSGPPEPSEEPSSDGTATATAPAPGLRRPWWWALGGAVLASAVWAGAFFLYAPDDAGPGPRNHREVGNLCQEATLTSLTGALGEAEHREPTEFRHADRDMVICSVNFGKVDASVSVQLTYTLHKRTDPGLEFDAAVSGQVARLGEPLRVTRVEGLGERAYSVEGLGQASRVLHVLDGQAVLAMDIHSGFNPEAGAQQTDVSGLRPYMIEDVRRLLARLRA
ncbi:hypothetical protein ACFVIM_29245 [Streptomyces sp. NPDC057638]|uniref:hypothetical protein n=1 Tax=Streptomyces sp. NPDC057638 TaxID=3346190 RepID=UPI00369E0910